MDGNKHTRRRHRRGVEAVKSALIVLLSLSAIYLALLALNYSNVSWSPLEDVLSFFHKEQATEDPFVPGQSTAAPKPVRIAVCDGSDHFASQYDTQQTDQIFDQVGILLSEALAGAEAPQQISEETWRQALTSPGVWFDFLGDIPLDVLYTWLGDGARNQALTHSARQMAVALDEDGSVRLYYHNEGNGLYYACDTNVVYPSHMEDLVSGYGSNGALFVFETGEESGYDGLDPYVLLSSGPIQPPVYHAVNPLADIDDATVSALQEALSFQPQSNTVYPVANGIRIREGRETLEISNDGIVTYHAAEGEASRYPISGGSGQDLLPLVEITRQLAADTVGRRCGSARLYLMGVEELSDGSVEVCYGYCLNGADVVLSDGGCAARFTVQNGQIVDYTLCFRQYDEAGATSAVLRERQAAAALDALDPDGRELILCYSDTGGDTVQAGWTAR